MNRAKVRWAWRSVAVLWLAYFGISGVISPAGGSAPKIVTFAGLAFTVPSSYSVLPGVNGYCEASGARVYIGYPRPTAVCLKISGPEAVIALAPTPPVAVLDPSSPTRSEQSHGVKYRLTVGPEGEGIIATFPGRKVSFYATNLGSQLSRRFQIAERVLASVRTAS